MSASVVIPVWDAYVGPALERAVAGAVAQPGVTQVLVVDNASRVPVPELPGAELVRAPRRLTTGAARNLGLAAVTEPVVLFLDADDRLLPGAVAVMLEALEADPGAVACCLRLLDGRGGAPFRTPRPAARALARAPRAFALTTTVWSVLPTQDCVALRTAVVRDAGGYADASSGEDWALGAALAWRGRIVFRAAPGAVYHWRAGSPGATSATRVVLTSGRRVRRRIARDPAVPRVVRAALPLLGAPQTAAVTTVRPVVRALRQPPGRRAAPPCWCTEQQADLVRAAVDPGPAGRAAWLRCRGGFEEEPGASARLGPAVFAHHLAGRPDDALHDLLKGSYRRAWYGNHVVLRAGRDAVGLLAGAGIEVLLLKGAALVADGTLGAATRPLNDVDLLVRPERHAAAAAVLAEAGWRPPWAKRGPLVHDQLLVGGGGRDLDLHAYALNQSADDERLWARARGAELLGRPVLVPCPTDQLLHVCVHGLRYSPQHGPAWAADALRLVASGAVAWEQLVEEAQRRRLQLPLGAALTHLAALFDTAIPVTALAALGAAAPSRTERAAHRAAMVRPSYPGLLVLMWDRYRRLAREAPAEARPRSFGAFLAEGYGLGAPGLAHRAVVTLARRSYRAPGAR